MNAIIAMVHNLRLEVAAEGMENESQVDFLMSRGCDFMRGYLFNRPLPVSDVVHYF